MVASGADVTATGKLHLFAAAFDTLEVQSLPTYIPPFALVIKLSGERGEGDAANHSLSVTGVRVDGDKVALIEDFKFELPEPRHSDQFTTSAAFIFPIALKATRFGKFQFLISVDGQDLGTIPLWIVQSSEGLQDA